MIPSRAIHPMLVSRDVRPVIGLSPMGAPGDFSQRAAGPVHHGRMRRDFTLCGLASIDVSPPGVSSAYSRFDSGARYHTSSGARVTFREKSTFRLIHVSPVSYSPVARLLVFRVSSPEVGRARYAPNGSGDFVSVL